MKKNSLFILVLTIFFSLFFVSCNPTPPSPPEDAGATQPIVQESTPTEAPLPTETTVPTPSPTPEPIPCTIAFDSNRDGNREVYRMAPDGSNPLNLSANPGDDFEPAWAPDGSQVAFVSNRANDQGEGQFIYVMNADGSSVRQLSYEPNSNWPDWSPDGNLITYTANDDIYVIPADGSGQSLNMTNSPEKDSQSTWSADGSKIAWLVGDEGNHNILVMYADGSNIRALTDKGRVSDVAWTVDNQLFTHWDNQEVGCFNCLMDGDGSNVKDAGGKGDLRRYLPFRTLDGQVVELVAGDNLTGDNEVFQVSEIYADMFLNLTNNPADDRNPDWPANCLSGIEPIDFQQAKDPGQIVIGYAGDDPQQPQRKTDFEKACGELAIECVYGDLPELTEQGVDAVVQNSNNVVAPGLHQDILNARDKGIPVFLLDAEVITDGAYSVTIDHRQWAATSLKWMFEKMGAQGQMAYFDLQPFDRYTDTIHELLAQYPGITVSDFRDGGYDAGKVKPETVDFAKGNPDIKAIWTSINMVHALRGLKESGIPQKQWPLVNCEASMDGLTTWKEIAQENPGFDCIAVANPPGIAYDAVYAAYTLATGAQIDESALGGQYGHSLYVDIPVITSENLQEWLDKAKAENMNLIDETMSPETIRERWFQE